MQTRFEQTRISQLTSTYGPDEPPKLPMNFGDFLSILWRLDRHADQPPKVKYYQQCATALAHGLGMQNRSLMRLVYTTPPGTVYKQLPNAPYRGTSHLIDAHDRKAAIKQLIDLRDEVLKIGTYQDQWPVGWPGSGIVDTELRERVFAVLFTALQGQFGHFGRLLFVVDIVLGDLLLGTELIEDVKLQQLVRDFDYPNPTDTQVRSSFYNGA